MSSPLASTAAHDAFRKTTPSEISACAIRGGVWNALRSYLEAFTADGQSAGEHRRIGTGASAHSRAADQSAVRRPPDALRSRIDHAPRQLASVVEEFAPFLMEAAAMAERQTPPAVDR
jgi:hypothetical protein